MVKRFACVDSIDETLCWSGQDWSNFLWKWAELVKLSAKVVGLIRLSVGIIGQIL